MPSEDNRESICGSTETAPTKAPALMLCFPVQATIPVVLLSLCQAYVLHPLEAVSALWRLLLPVVHHVASVPTQ